MNSAYVELARHYSAPRTTITHPFSWFRNAGISLVALNELAYPISYASCLSGLALPVVPADSKSKLSKNLSASSLSISRRCPPGCDVKREVGAVKSTTVFLCALLPVSVFFFAFVRVCGCLTFATSMWTFDHCRHLFCVCACREVSITMCVLRC